jgi:hypothetical protein
MEAGYVKLRIDSDWLLDLLAQVRAIEAENIILKEQAASNKQQAASENFEINLDKLEE